MAEWGIHPIMLSCWRLDSGVPVGNPATYTGDQLPHSQLTARGRRRVSSEHHTRTAQAQVQENCFAQLHCLVYITSLTPTIWLTSKWLSSTSQLLRHG